MNCQDCNESMGTEEEYRCHYSAVHLNYFPFNCHYCRQWFAASVKLQFHLQRDHPTEYVRVNCNPDLKLEAELDAVVLRQFSALTSTIVSPNSATTSRKRRSIDAQKQMHILPFINDTKIEHTLSGEGDTRAKRCRGSASVIDQVTGEICWPSSPPPSPSQSQRSAIEVLTVAENENTLNADQELLSNHDDSSSAVVSYDDGERSGESRSLPRFLSRLVRSAPDLSQGIKATMSAEGVLLFENVVRPITLEALDVCADPRHLSPYCSRRIQEVPGFAELSADERDRICGRVRSWAYECRKKLLGKGQRGFWSIDGASTPLQPKTFATDEINTLERNEQRESNE